MPIFKRREQSPTGHAGDDALLAQIALQSDLTAPRHWVHYLYCVSEAAAHKAGAEISAAGWNLQRVDVAAKGPGWIVIAERRDAVTSPETVSAARAFFEAVASRVDGGDYDGWEASL